MSMSHVLKRLDIDLDEIEDSDDDAFIANSNPSNGSQRTSYLDDHHSHGHGAVNNVIANREAGEVRDIFDINLSDIDDDDWGIDDDDNNEKHANKKTPLSSNENSVGHGVEGEIDTANSCAVNILGGGPDFDSGVWDEMEYDDDATKAATHKSTLDIHTAMPLNDSTAIHSIVTSRAYAGSNAEQRTNDSGAIVTDVTIDDEVGTGKDRKKEKETEKNHRKDQAEHETDVLKDRKKEKRKKRKKRRKGDKEKGKHKYDNQNNSRRRTSTTLYLDYDVDDAEKNHSAFENRTSGSSKKKKSPKVRHQSLNKRNESNEREPSTKQLDSLAHLRVQYMNTSDRELSADSRHFNYYDDDFGQHHMDHSCEDNSNSYNVDSNRRSRISSNVKRNGGHVSDRNGDDRSNSDEIGERAGSAMSEDKKVNALQKRVERLQTMIRESMATNALTQHSDNQHETMISYNSNSSHEYSNSTNNTQSAIVNITDIDANGIFRIDGDESDIDLRLLAYHHDKQQYLHSSQCENKRNAHPRSSYQGIEDYSHNKDKSDFTTSAYVYGHDEEELNIYRLTNNVSSNHQKQKRVGSATKHRLKARSGKEIVNERGRVKGRNDKGDGLTPNLKSILSSSSALRKKRGKPYSNIASRIDNRRERASKVTVHTLESFEWKRFASTKKTLSSSSSSKAVVAKGGSLEIDFSSPTDLKRLESWIQLTPRSLKACRRLGIEPVELVKRPLSFFKSQIQAQKLLDRSKTLSSATVAIASPHSAARSLDKERPKRTPGPYKSNDIGNGTPDDRKALVGITESSPPSSSLSSSSLEVVPCTPQYRRRGKKRTTLVERQSQLSRSSEKSTARSAMSLHVKKRPPPRREKEGQSTRQAVMTPAFVRRKAQHYDHRRVANLEVKDVCIRSARFRLSLISIQ